MAYIYEIVNDINNKRYVGKTEFSLEKRFKEHCHDSKKLTAEKRPLYAAMRKYGTEHFSIHLLEETDCPEERERYWIEILNTFHYGYNATHGGDGKSYIDPEPIFELYQKGYTQKKIAEILKCDIWSVRHALEKYNITSQERKKRQIKHVSKQVVQINVDTEEIIAVYDSISAAYRALGKRTQGGGISKVCKGKASIAYGYKWKYLEDIDNI